MVENNAIVVGTLGQFLNLLEARSFVRVFERTEDGSELRMAGSVMHLLESESISHLLEKYRNRSIEAIWFYAADTTILVEKAVV